MNVVIAGGGVAGLEALLGLRAVAGDRVRVTLIAPDPDFTYRPLAVAEPFALGRAHRVPLRTLAQETGAELVEDAVVAVDDRAHEVRLRDGGTRGFDALLVAPGGRPVDGVPGATTWWPGGDPEHYGGLLRDIEEGYTKRFAMVVPPGSVWPLPAYELALMTAGEARAMGQGDVEVTVVTPEREPLSLFGREASAALADELGNAGVRLRTGVVARVEPGGLALVAAARRLEGEPDGGEHLAVQRVFAVPRLVGPAIEGLPCDDEGFIVAGDDARVDGCERTWAAGDGVVSPVKFGALATHQARRAVAAIARLAGVPDAPDPGDPVLVGRLMVGSRTRRLIPRADVDSKPLWWPAGKVAGEYLPRWLAEHGVAPAAAHEPPAGGVDVRRPLRDVRGAEAQYLYDLARQFRTDDPEIAALGRRLRATAG
jgi:sulfide:quinone oxidoreductase